jgi:sarcosine oxidase
MASHYDVILVGLGAMGSAAAFHLARNGRRVLGLDRFAPPHQAGSSHGQTRIIREAYFEHPTYVPLVQRAYELWEELERLSGAPLLRPTGGLMMGPPDGVLVSGAKRSADTHRLRHEVLTAAEIRRRFPALTPEDDMSGIWEPRAGVLFPERCIAAHLTLAAQSGAQFRFEEPALRWHASADGVGVITPKSEYVAAHLIISAGSWIESLVPDLKLPFTIERQVQFWFEPANSPALFYPERCPIHLWQFDEQRFFYGFPDVGCGVKVACHHDGEVTMPDRVNRQIAPGELASMRAIVRRFLPLADGPLRSTTVCLYTNTPDQHFWIDRHPQYPQVLLASPCSGHGFKFSSVIGEILCSLVCQGHCAFDLSLFRTRW